MIDFSPKYIDIVGLVITFPLLTILGIYLRKKVKWWVWITILVIGILGIILDGYSVWMEFFKGA
jgi:hypothetical protein